MSYTYTVNKAKINRLSYRILGLVFLLISTLQITSLFRGFAKHPMLTGMFALFLGLYGLYLVRMSFRKLAYDITYIFNEEGLTVKHHYGETKYTFDDIEFVSMIIADEHMIFYVMNLKAKKDIYTIPFTMKKALCEAIYEFVNSRIKHDDDDNSNETSESNN